MGSNKGSGDGCENQKKQNDAPKKNLPVGQESFDPYESFFLSTSHFYFSTIAYLGIHKGVKQIYDQIHDNKNKGKDQNDPLNQREISRDDCRDSHFP